MLVHTPAHASARKRPLTSLSSPSNGTELSDFSSKKRIKTPLSVSVPQDENSDLQSPTFKSPTFKSPNRGLSARAPLSSTRAPISSTRAPVRPCTPASSRSVSGADLLVPFGSQAKPTPAAKKMPTPLAKPTPSRLSEALQVLGWDFADFGKQGAAQATPPADASEWLDVATSAYVQQPENLGRYAALCSAGLPEASVASQVAVDIVRTDLGENLREEVLTVRRGALQRVLHAFSLHDTATSYVQGMDCIAAAALMHPNAECGVMHPDGTWSSAAASVTEERAFWWLVHVTSTILRGFFSSGMPALWNELGVLRAAITSIRPKLLAHADKLGFDLSLLAPGWYLTLFQRILERGEADQALHALSTKALEPIHIALGIVLTSEAALLAAKDFDQAANALCGTVCASRSQRTPVGVLAQALKVSSTLLPPKKLAALRASEASSAAGGRKAADPTAETPRARQATRRWFESPWATKAA